MKLFKKVLATGLSVLMFSHTNVPLHAAIKEQFTSFSGTISEISFFVNQDGKEDPSKKYVLTENSEGNLVNFFVDSNTYVFDKNVLETGNEIIGFYDTNRPTLMINPPQFHAEVIAPKHDVETIKVDRFNENLVSSDNMLRLNIADSTEIILANGEAFDGELKNRKLAVVYDISTRSIPALTTPKKIVVLYEKIEPADEKTETENKPIQATQLVVNGSLLENEKPIVRDQSILVPLRPVVEALGINLTWNDKNHSITLGDVISLQIASPTCINGKGDEVTLELSPELIDERTYVPLTFFKSVLFMNNAYVAESQAVIDNGIKFE